MDQHGIPLVFIILISIILTIALTVLGIIIGFVLSSQSDMLA